MIILGFLAAWELGAATGVVDSRTVSSPTAIVSTLAEMLGGGDGGAAWAAVIETMRALLVAFALGVGIGLAIGLPIAFSALLREAYLPFVLYLLGVPKTIFLPLFVLFFGLGSGSAIAFGAVLAFLQVAVNVVGGIDTVETKYFAVARAFGASRWQRFVHVILPGAAPGLFAALWHGLRNAFVGVLIAQMFVSNLGIGYLVRVYTNQLRIDAAMALILLASVLIILIGSLWELGERRLLRWRTVQG